MVTLPAQALAIVFGVRLVASAGGVLLRARLGLYLAVVGSAFLTLIGTVLALVLALVVSLASVVVGVAGPPYFQHVLACRDCFR